EACERLQLPERAMNVARAAATVAPDRTDVRAKCGLLLLEYNQVVEARPHLERAVELASKDRAARLGLARCLHALDETSSALRLLDDLLADRPDDPEALGVRGRALLQAGQPAEAVHSLTQALERAPSDLEALHTLALALSEVGRAAEAKTCLE